MFKELEKAMTEIFEGFKKAAEDSQEISEQANGRTTLYNIKAETAQEIWNKLKDVKPAKKVKAPAKKKDK